eukprot:TRINITY_DN27359_c0_g1_i1.p1 TRINITY_DN27359_c0_g1~~TRINITY_DN27359_c0_g1_i1.p1  ORF type:complete len:211 (+),score=37.62 TRINITY_DN27359_c0_g1_i1:113-745(+)
MCIRDRVSTQSTWGEIRHILIMPYCHYFCEQLKQQLKINQLEANMTIEEIIAKELGIRLSQVNNVIELLDGGNTVPFISRYRKEVTGGLSDEVLRKLSERLTYLRNLEERKTDVKRLIEEQGKLTEELVSALDKAVTLTEVEDIYRPYKPKKRTKATIAIGKGLKPLAELIMEGIFKGDLNIEASKYINCLLYTSPSPRDLSTSRMPSSA